MAKVTASRFREEVLNVLLSQLLAGRGVVSAPEQIVKEGHRRHMPDVVVVFQGLRTALEGKFDGSRDAAKEAQSQASSRVEQGVAQIGLAILYPESLRSEGSVASLRREMCTVPYRVSVCTESGNSGWSECDLERLGDALRRTFDELVAEDVVSSAVSALEAGVERFGNVMARFPAIADRSALVLGVREPTRKTDEDE
ncbi:MAG TPA: hypothetical protein VFC53_09830 [Dehalococcoidia bacterium]|nr:hypothetical protein [Dehalococcoidia bacterium]